MRVNIIIVCSFWLFFLSCKDKQDIIDNSFSKKYKTNEQSFVISSNIKENESYMIGEFKYFSNNFSIKNQIYIRDTQLFLWSFMKYILLAFPSFPLKLLLPITVRVPILALIFSAGIFFHISILL